MMETSHTDQDLRWAPMRHTTVSRRTVLGGMVSAGVAGVVGAGTQGPRTSGNGWVLIDEAQDRRLDAEWVVAGLRAQGGVIRGAAGHALAFAVADMLNRDVEVIAGQCWGWRSPSRLSRGSWSNHGSGTALDLAVRSGLTFMDLRGAAEAVEVAVRQSGRVPVNVAPWAEAGRCGLHIEIAVAPTAIVTAAPAV